MRVRRSFLPFCFLVSLSIWGCHPFDPLNGEFNAGSIDPFDFAPPYRTSNGLLTNGLAAFGNPTACMRQVEGSCTIQEFRAYINGTPTGYFRFPFSPSQITTTQYPATTTVSAAYSTVGDANFLNPTQFTSLRVSGAGAIPTPNIYIFDPGAASPQCVPPSGYSFDPYRDAVHYDTQGPIFVTLPTANYGIGANPTWTYTPVVQRVPVTSNGEGCQDIKSEITVLTSSKVTVPQGPIRPDGSPTGLPDGTYYAWALIDPGAQVFKLSDSPTDFGYSHHKYGWFNQYLVAYLDGGRVPIVQGSNPPRMLTQPLYYPRTIGTPPAPFTLGGNQDVIKYAPGQDGFSPICQVISYAFPGPATAVPHDAATIEATYLGTFQPPPAPTVQGGPITPTFTFCLQLP
jgi:hypothetical protein